MKKFFSIRILFLILPLTAIQTGYAQITLTMSGTGKHPSTVESGPTPTLVLYHSSGADCSATVTFTNAGGAASWKMYSSGSYGPFPLGIMSDGATPITLSADPILGTA